MFCPSCGVQLVSDTTPFCTHCGSPVIMAPVVVAPVQAAGVAPTTVPAVQIAINAASPHTEVTANPNMKGTYGLPIPSMVIGIFCALSLFDNSKWDSDQINGAFIICAAGLTLGIVSLCRQRKGKGMAVAGIVTSSIGLLAVLGRLP